MLTTTLRSKFTVPLLLLLGGCGIPLEEHNRLMDQLREENRGRMQALADRLSAEQGKTVKLATQASSLTSIVGSAQLALGTAQSALAQANQQLDKVRSQADLIRDAGGMAASSGPHVTPVAAPELPPPAQTVD